MAEDQSPLDELILPDMTIVPGAWMYNHEAGISVLNNGKFPVLVTIRQLKQTTSKPRCKTSFYLGDDMDIYCELPEAHEGLHEYESFGNRIKSEVMP